jgi:hypothetical protein
MMMILRFPELGKTKALIKALCARIGFQNRELHTMFTRYCGVHNFFDEVTSDATPLILRLETDGLNFEGNISFMHFDSSLTPQALRRGPQANPIATGAP